MMQTRNFTTVIDKDQTGHGNKLEANLKGAQVAVCMVLQMDVGARWAWAST
jgi:hypothetical protein